MWRRFVRVVGAWTRASHPARRGTALAWSRPDHAWRPSLEPRALVLTRPAVPLKELAPERCDHPLVGQARGSSESVRTLCLRSLRGDRVLLGGGSVTDDLAAFEKRAVGVSLALTGFEFYNVRGHCPVSKS
jgi:hypothetical protein